MAIAVINLFGCASITGSTGQNISITAKDKEKQVSGASCELSNSKGKWYINTPGSLQINRSNDDLMVICKKNGLDHGTASVESDTKPGMIGNVIFGGGIGAIIDHNTGAAYEYPNSIEVIMGMQTKISVPKVAQQASDPNNTNISSNGPQQIGTSPVIISSPVNTQNPLNSTEVNTKDKNGTPQKRLEELNSMLKKGLITQQDYSTKKAEILQSM